MFFLNKENSRLVDENMNVSSNALPAYLYTGTIGSAQVNKLPLYKIESIVNEQLSSQELPSAVSFVPPDRYGLVYDALKHLRASNTADISHLPTSIAAPALIISRFTSPAKVVYDIIETRNDDNTSDLGSMLTSKLGLRSQLFRTSSDISEEDLLKSSERRARILNGVLNTMFLIVVLVALYDWATTNTATSLTLMMGFLFVMFVLDGGNPMKPLFSREYGAYAISALKVARTNEETGTLMDALTSTRSSVSLVRTYGTLSAKLFLVAFIVIAIPLLFYTADVVFGWGVVYQPPAISSVWG